MLFFYLALFVWTQQKKYRSTWTTGTIFFRCVRSLHSTSANN